MSTTVFGIKNCDTVKKARKWLDNAGVDYRFHDLREDGLDQRQVARWIKALGWETVVNKRSTTWKQLDESTRQSLDDKQAIEVILQHPTLIKRPLLDLDGQFFVGFREADYQSLF